MMETKIIINDNQAPFIPEDSVLFEHQDYGIREFNPELIKLINLDEIEGPFIWEEGYVNLNASLLDHFLAHPEDIPEKREFEKTKEFGDPIYFMDTTYNPVSANKNGTFAKVRSMIYDRENNVWKEGPTHSYNQEFYGGYAILHKIDEKIEKQKKVGSEMKKLVENTGKTVRVFLTEPGKGSHFDKYPEGYLCLLEEVIPYKGVYTFNKNGMENEHGELPFIGPVDGIYKIIAEETGEVLYDNSSLRYVIKAETPEQRLELINNLRESKYGTSVYNLAELPL